MGVNPNAESIVLPPIINAALAVGAIIRMEGFLISSPAFNFRILTSQ